jgi:PKD repeat protein
VATLIYSNPTALYENMGTDAMAQVLNFKAPNPIPRTEGDSSFAKAPSLNFNELRTGALEDTDNWSHRRAAVPADAYAIHLQIGETVTIRMSAQFNAYLYLFADVNGEVLLTSNDDSTPMTTNAQIIWTAEKASTYYLEATAHNRQEVGAYALEILAGKVNQAPFAHPFEIIGNNDTAPMTVTFTDFSIDPDGEIGEHCWRFADNTPLTCADAAVITHTYEVAGLYAVGLMVQDKDGAYAYATESVTVKPPAIGSGIVLAMLNSITGELASADSRSQTRTGAFADLYRLNSIVPGQELVIEMTSEQFDSYLYLYNEFKQLLYQDDNSGGGNHARLRYTPSDTSELLVEATSVRDNTLGKYTLSLQPASSTIPVTLEILPALTNPLQNLLIARLPANFKATALSWNFGDNSAAKVTNDTIVSHTYATEGYFNVTVQAFNAENQQVTGNKNFSIRRQVQMPQIHFQASPLFGEQPLRVFFQNDSAVTAEALRYLWQFDDGEVSSELHPAHTFKRGGTYHVSLQTLIPTTGQKASYAIPITVIDRHSGEIPITGIVRERPQVLMAGFDPMLIDVLDTQVKIFAIVRPGKMPLQTVRFLPSQSDFGLVMQPVATYNNGDLRYETVLTFSQGSLPVTTLADLLGEQIGQVKIQAIDQAGQFHTFPNLEIGNNLPLTVLPKSLNFEPMPQVNSRRRQPQVLAAGFDPILVHVTQTAPTLTNSSDAQFTVKAIVREGLFPIKSVTLNQNQSMFNLPLHLMETLPSGDKLYAVHYTYPIHTLIKGTLGNLFGSKPSQFTVTVTDNAFQTHRFPEVIIGNFQQ